MANHALPITTSLYTDVLTNLKDRIDDSLKMLDSVNTTPTNVPTNSVRFNSTTFLWEKYNGSAWVSLASSYAIKVSKSINLTGGNSTTLLGSIPYQSNTDSTTLLAPNTTTTRKFLRQTGSGTNGSAPVWDTILASDIPVLDTSKITTGTLPVSRGGTGVTTSTGTGSVVLSESPTFTGTVTAPTFSGALTGTATNATTALNQSGGSVNATTGRFNNDVIASQSISIGTGGNYSAGSIYSDSSWGMVFRAKQASPSQAIFRWADAADTELFRWNGSALTCSITGTATNANNLGGNAPSYYQQALGFTPVQQGTGIGQLGNTVKIGWSHEHRLKVTVDATDIGNIVMDSNQIGIGIYQTWQDVTASRSSGVTYTNNTGKPIIISIFHASGATQILVNGYSNGIDQGSSNNTNTITERVIPVGATYSVKDTAVIKWSELR